jgi:endonuclease/exonuclease/phosphatase family metal-dependent hydrolase
MPPVVRIDYVWHTRHFIATRAWVGGRTGSDHLPVIAELAWR